MTSRRPPRWTRRLILASVFAAALVPVAARPAMACSCVPSTAKERAKDAQAVFTGTVTRVTDGPGDRTVNFDVDTVYKGEAVPSIDVHTGYGGGDCGIRFAVDRRYTVFALRANGVLNASSCAAPVAGDINPAALGLGPGVTGLHRPLSAWLVVFTVAAAVAVGAALVVVARRRAAWRLPGGDQPK